MNERIIYQFKAGSHLYGTTTETSDVDIRGIYLPSAGEYLSLREPRDIHQQGDEIDTIIYHLKKFFQLALNSNPSVLEFFFVPPEMTQIYDARIMDSILRGTKFFISKKVYNSFRGYAYAQFERIYKEGHEIGAKRRETLQKYGYNTKAAMHLFRLLDEGAELLETGRITFPRPNVGFLRSVKEGDIGPSAVESRFHEKLAEIDEVYERSNLPDDVDFNSANMLLIHLLQGIRL